MSTSRWRLPLLCTLAMGSSGCRVGYEIIDLRGHSGDTAVGGDAGLDEAPGGPSVGGVASVASSSLGGAGGGVSSASEGGTSTAVGGAASTAGGSPSGGSGASSSVGGASGGVDAGSLDAAVPCGNGVVDALEECDVGSALAEDRCLATCRWDWYDRDYTRRRRVRFANASGAATLSDFAVPIALDASVVPFADLGPNGEDLLFVDDAHTGELAYEIEHWDVSGAGLVWLRVPSIPATDSGYVWMYYLSPGAPARQAPTAVWAAPYEAVFHLNGSADDSTGRNDGAMSNVASTAGELAGGLDFSAVDSRVNAGSDASIDDLFANGGTVSAWIRPRSYGAGDFGRVLDKASDTFTSAGWGLQLDNGANDPNHTLKFEHGFSGNFGGWDAGDEAIALDVWSHVAVSYDGSSDANTPALYVNGVRQSVVAVNPPTGAFASDASLELGIGDILASTDRTFDGVIDEVRLERTLRDDDWVDALFRSAQPGFVGFDPEHVVDAP